METVALRGLGAYVEATKLYALAAARVAARGRYRTGGLRAREERLVFVAGAPRSGTTFLGSSIGAARGFVDLGEVLPLKSRVAELVRLPEDEAAAEVRRVLERVRSLAFVRGLRGVEQTPETAFLVDAVALAYPEGRRVHIVRDGRDVVCSLLERGWLSARRGQEADDVDATYGTHARFWVEPERVEEFARASDATRAAWAWRRYVTAARSARAECLQLSYEELAADPARAAVELGAYLDADPALLREPLARVHTRSVGRFRRDLSAEQLRDVEAEAGPLLAELGYA